MKSTTPSQTKSVIRYYELDPELFIPKRYFSLFPSHTFPHHRLKRNIHGLTDTQWETCVETQREYQTLH